MSIMNLRRNNRLIVDLNKVQFSVFYYRNQHGQVRTYAPVTPTFHNEGIGCDTLAAFLPDYPGETLIQRIHRRGEQLDEWTPELFLKLSANHGLIYTGTKAVEMDKAWRGKIFGKKKSTNKKQNENTTVIHH